MFKVFALNIDKVFYGLALLDTGLRLLFINLSVGRENCSIHLNLLCSPYVILMMMSLTFKCKTKF